MTTSVREVIEETHRREWGRVFAATARLTGDLDLAEEATQEAYVVALETWAERGVPANPAAWLTTTARRRALDRLRRERTLARKLPLLLEPEEEYAMDTWPPVDGESPGDIPDERLRLVFTCCHPALAVEAQIALTLRLVCGLTTPEIARALLISEATMAARITRAKKKITAARIPYRVPPADALPERLPGVLHVVHLVFTEGYSASSGDRLVRAELVDRSLHLARVLAGLMPDEPEVLGLLALILLTDARRATRVDAEGRFVLLEDQDRSRWDQRLIEEGRGLVLTALRRSTDGRYALQAAIAAVHADARSYAETDWAQIVSLYGALLRVWPSPVVELNRAVAVAMADGPQVGLALVNQVGRDPRLATYHLLPAARADLLRRLGRHSEAADAYRAALTLARSEPDRAYLSGRLAECERGL